MRPVIALEEGRIGLTAVVGVGVACDEAERYRVICGRLHFTIGKNPCQVAVDEHCHAVTVAGG